MREYAIGAVDEYGAHLLNEREATTVDRAWLAGEISRQIAEAERRGRVYREGRERLDLKSRVVIIADDGIATGYTMRLVIRSVRALAPAKIVVAVPVAPLDALKVLESDGADEMVVLEPPENFAGVVGAHYAHFNQIEDEAVIDLLRRMKSF